jgi:predicted ATP-grasp superfamily ATP-dependent carboligase
MSAAGAPGAVVIGGYANALGVVRALAGCGVRVAVVTTKPFDIAHLSRFAAERHHLPRFHEAPDSLIELLEGESRRWRGWALFPTNDHALEAIARHADRLRAAYRLTSPDWEIARRFLRKDETYRIAGEIGIDFPIVYGPARADTAARDDLTFPVVVKPTESHVFAERFGCKLFVARNRAELARCCAIASQAGIDAQVIDLVPGGDDCIYGHAVYMDAGGIPRAAITMRKLRQSPPLYGVARVAETVHGRPDVADAAVALLARIGLRGMCDVQFKLDPRDGRLRLMEVNGRAVLYNQLVRKAGVNLAYMAWAEAVEGEHVEQRPNGWNGVWIHLHADVLYSLFLRRLEDITWRQYLAPYHRPKTFAVWSARDPRPFAAQWGRSARDAAGALLRGRLPEPLRREPAVLPLCSLRAPRTDADCRAQRRW